MGALRYYICTVVVFAAVAGFYLGGDYVWLGIGTFPILLFFDLILPQDNKQWKISVPFLADLPLYLHVALMVTMYVLVIRWMAVLGGPFSATGEINLLQVIGAIASIGWVSAVPNLPIAHELMHRTHWFPVFCSRLLNTMYYDPNRDIGHIITHHIHFNTPKDSDTPYRGQTIYHFIIQATLGGYKDAIQAEASRLYNRGKSIWHISNKTYYQVFLLLAVPLTVGILSGHWLGGVVIFISMITAKAIVEAFNYHQHYGLIRLENAPVQLHHAWNHLGAIVRPIGVEITNHINHHEDSYVPFYALKPHPEGPNMPSIFLCFLASLIPPLWFGAIIKPKLKDWDNRFASPEEQTLAMEANRKAGWPEWVGPVSATT